MDSYHLEIINRQENLISLIEKLTRTPVLALDIETLQWWDKYRERVALVQIAYRIPEQGIRVAIIDALAKELNLEIFRSILESQNITKAIHNSAFDAGKLFKHYKFKLAPIFDTMAAARRNGEKKYSLAAQAATHLNLRLDKSAQRSDWSRRPLDLKQLDYAARDAYVTFLLYEHQQQRGLIGGYLYHLWHGEIEKRQYFKRIREFAPINRTIKSRDRNGLYETPDGADSRYVTSYFAERETGSEAAVEEEAVNLLENIIAHEAQTETSTAEPSTVSNDSDWQSFGGGDFAGGGAGGSWGVPVSEAASPASDYSLTFPEKFNSVKRKTNIIFPGKTCLNQPSTDK